MAEPVGPLCNPQDKWISRAPYLANPHSMTTLGCRGYFAGPGPLEGNLKKAVAHPESPEGRRLGGVGFRKWLDDIGGGKLIGMQLPWLIKMFADELVGEPVLGDGECYALVDMILTAATAKSAPRFGIVTPVADYVWGTSIALSDVKPGDILQMRNFIVTTTTTTKTVKTYKSRDPDERTDNKGDIRRRPHHSAIVVEVHGGQRWTIVEQHLINRDTNPPEHYTDVRKNTIDTLDSVSDPIRETRTGVEADEPFTETKTTIKTIKVSGTIWAYRAQPDDFAPQPPRTPSRAAPRGATPVPPRIPARAVPKVFRQRKTR